MKKVLTTIIVAAILMLYTGNASAQESTNDFKTTVINKKVKDFSDKFDLSTPLNSYITIMNIMANGKGGKWRAVSSESIKSYLPKPNTADEEISEESKEKYRNTDIKEIIIYKDSVAVIITDNGSSFYTRTLILENKQWVNVGEGRHKNLQEAQQQFKEYAQRNLGRLHMMEKVSAIPTDTVAFFNYAKKYGKQPKTYLLNVLAKHKLVIYGEIHRRKISWELLKNTLNDARFAKTVGTVFVELPSYQQSEFDRFYASEKLDTEILLDIMRSEQVYGWFDRGEYEFLIDVWKVNQKLPKGKRIRVVATDAQIPYKQIKTPEEFKACYDTMPNRNTNMADIIERTIRSSADKRNYLFIVGYGHAYKSEALGGASSYNGEAQLTAGAQLAKRLPKGDVFTIIQHAPVISNIGHIGGKIRHGMFDTVFALLGDQPIAFNLHNSPFGKEPFDADMEGRYDEKIGRFEDNFDGYIFLQPLKDEESNYLLYDIYSDKFVIEIKRRAALMGDSIKDMYGTDDINKELLIKLLKSENQEKKRWSKLFE